MVILNNIQPPLKDFINEASLPNFLLSFDQNVFIIQHIIINSHCIFAVAKHLYPVSRVKGWNPFEDSVNFGAMSEDVLFGKNYKTL